MQWALAYLAGAWLVLQVIDVLREPWALPELLVRGVHALLGIGFILALVIAWYHGEKGRQRVTAAELLIIALLFGIAGGVLRAVQLRGAAETDAGADIAVSAERERPSIAVLPFDNISPDPGDAYFADGMHDEIITQLGRIRSLAVISRNSVMQYRGGAVPTRKIAAELGVDFVLEGSARKDTARTRITAQLIDARSDEHLWVEVYDRDLSTASLLDIQDDIARRVAGALRVRISSVERGRIGDRPTESRAAYDLYLRASQLRWSDRSANAAAAELLKQALSLDPGFAQARAMLSLVYSRRSLLLGDSREWADSGIALARRAIDDDPSLPLGHYALAEGYAELGRLTNAVEGFEKVLELQPSNGTALAALGWIRYLRGRLDDAVDLMRQARRIDPRNSTVTLGMAEFETNFGNYRKAERWVQATEALAPNHVYLSTQRVLLLLAEGKTSEAVDEAERRLSEKPQSFEALSMAAEAWLRAGNYEQARQYLEALQRVAPQDWDVVGRTYRTLYGWTLLKLGDAERGLALLEEVVQEARRLIDQGDEQPGLRREVAAVYAATGDRRRAYEWLERAINSGWRLERMYPTPLFEPLRGEERFQQLMGRIDADLERMKARVEREGLAPPLP